MSRTTFSALATVAAAVAASLSVSTTSSPTGGGWAATSVDARAPEPYRIAFEPEVGQLDPRLPSYKPPAGLKGKLSFAGSNSMRNLVDAWVTGFAEKCPEVQVDYDAVGSRNGAPMLAAGEVPICVCSRPMMREERDAFQKNFGYAPVELSPALLVFAVYVHKDNPARPPNLAELDGMWSSTRVRGGPDVSRWGQLGCVGERDRLITLYAFDRDIVRDPVDAVLSGGRLKETIVQDENDSVSAVERLAKDEFGAAYGPAGLRREYLRPLPMVAEDGRPAAPNYAGIRDGRWPLVRRFYMYVNKRPDRPVDPVVRELLRFIYSREGQNIVLQDEKVPVSREIAEDALKQLD